MIARLAWVAALILAALVTLQLQLDRESARNPSLAPLVAGPFRGNAQTLAAATALASGDAGGALREARKLVIGNPAPAENLTILATAQFKAGQADAATATIQLAAKRGWREPLAQQAMAQLALEAGDMPEAARRFAALFINQSVPDARLLDLSAAIMAEPAGQGRATMTEIVTAAERWHSLFLRRGPAVMAPDAFAEIAIGSIAGGATFECSGLTSAAKRVARADLQAAGRLVAASRRLCPLIALD